MINVIMGITRSITFPFVPAGRPGGGAQIAVQLTADEMDPDMRAFQKLHGRKYGIGIQCDLLGGVFFQLPDQIKAGGGIVNKKSIAGTNLLTGGPGNGYFIGGILIQIFTDAVLVERFSDSFGAPVYTH